MHCIICGNSLENAYYIGKKLDMNIFLCKDHKLFCTNDCEIVKVNEHLLN